MSDHRRDGTMATDGRRAPGARPRVVVVGGGFAGIHAVKGLRDLPVDVTLVDRRNFHLFQPLTYQVATGALSAGEVAYPLRAMFRSARNVTVLMAEVAGFDLDARRVELAVEPGVPAVRSLDYDTLVVAAGSSYSYFGHDEWAAAAPEVKSLESALAARARILTAFERAETLQDDELRQAELTFVVVGGGPTGVEMAGQIGELARSTLPGDFRGIDSRHARILLVEATDRLLLTFPPSLSAKATTALRQLGVTPVLDRTVVGVDAGGVDVQAPDGSTERLAARTVIWAAGVRASGLAAQMGERSGAEVDRAGRLTVEPDLSLPGHPEVFALGDMVRARDARSGQVVTFPGVAPVAIQQGRYAARVIGDRLQGRASKPFRYHDKGNLATIGRARAVADLHVLRLSGFPAWVTWLVVHLWYLVGFQNRLLVLIRWALDFSTRWRGARLITRVPPSPGAPAQDASQRVGEPGRQSVR
ncbi:MAG TPA: NAD(P)/FAD-dependent oxidoreductase [Baekduia sp.]|nr:NAD(P)/FAD-dependent oxidoreductase [Baekduia sp.]